MDGELRTSKRASERATSPGRPRLVVALGRGKTGKSTLLRYIGETAARTRRLRIIDADPDHQTLCQHFEDAERPLSNDGADRRLWIEDQISQLMLAAGGEGEPHDMLLDLGGGDQLMKRLGAELNLVDVLEEVGIDVTAVHMIGPSEQDLGFLADVERRRLFCPKRTLVVINAGLVPGERSFAVAFAHVMASPIMKEVTSAARGGKMVVMPALECMPQMEEGGVKTLAGKLRDEERKVIPPLSAIRLHKWQSKMADLRTECGDWLP